jgi:hypothetical protein
MKTTFIKDTVISIDYKDAKYIVSYFNGYAKIDKYVKDVFNSSFTVYPNMKFVVDKPAADGNTKLDNTIKFATISNLNDPTVVNAIKNSLKK